MVVVRLVLLLLCGGCATSATSATSAAFPVQWDVARLQPPKQYRTHWRKMEQCSGLRRSFDVVRWYVAFGKLSVYGKWAGALTWVKTDQIVIQAAFVDVDYIVEHEILHILLQQPGHPTPPFGKCSASHIL